MFTFLLGMFLGGIAIILGLFYYQKKHARDITDEKGEYIDKEENPLSMKNIHSSQKKLHTFLKEEAQQAIVLTLKFLIFIKKNSRKLLDKAITKLAHIAFPEQKIHGPLDENDVLSHVENQKKESSGGRIE